MWPSSAPGLPGLFCAIHAAGPGHRIVLFEKNARAGENSCFAGSGQCNITHAGEITGFVTHYGSHGRFLKPALMGYSNQALIRFFTDRGLAMVTEENGKVFPETRSSADVLRLLIQECGRRGVEIRCGTGHRDRKRRCGVHDHIGKRHALRHEPCHHYRGRVVPEDRVCR